MLVLNLMLLPQPLVLSLLLQPLWADSVDNAH
jgi:hypothetical protein